jgi:hypothetical protein
MLFYIASALLLLQAAPSDTIQEPQPAPATAPLPTDSYLDDAARELVARARERRETVDRSIAQYRTVARDRVSVGARAAGRDRTLYMHETAARILWRRDAPGEIEMLGARSATPMFSSDVRVPSPLGGMGTYLAFDPADPDLIRAAFTDSDNSVRHPLAVGSEAHYRFRSGDITRVRLADGTTLRLVELQVIPRRKEFFLASGSLWLDADTHALVRAVMRPARPWDIDLDGDEDSSDVPRLVKPIRGEIRYIAIEYGLWEMRWWMPRLITFEGVAEVGALGGLGGTIRYERTYSDFQISGAPAASPASDADSVLTRCPKEKEKGPGSLSCRCLGGRCYQFAVHVPQDTASLLNSPYLPPSFFAPGPALITDSEMRQIRELIDRIQPPVWALQRPTLRWEVARADLLRYNRVEGLSVGARGSADFGALSADATVRLGAADLEPNVEAGLERQSFDRRLRVAGYRRLANVDPAQRPLGLGNSLSALFLGRDEGDYFRALGAEVVGTPPRSAAQPYRWRLFAERQREAVKETDFSLPHLLDREREFRPNLAAERADQIGASLELRTERGLDPAGFRWGAEAFVEGAAGTFGYLRPSLALSAATPLPGRFRGAVEVAGGSSFGELPAQSAWYLGGTGSVRGYAPRAATGEAFWRARAEVGNQLPGARWVLFSDAGWAGSRDAVQLDPQLLSAGAGVSFLDGLVRFDLARALRGERQWRAELYVNGTL